MYHPAPARLLAFAAIAAAACGTDVCGSARGQETWPAPGPPAWSSDPAWAVAPARDTAWRWRPLPASLLFKPFIAGVKAPRLAGTLLSVDGGNTGDTVLDAALGARVGLIRFGQDGPNADGWQLDVLAAAFPRLNLDEEGDVDATDFRVGVPLTYRSGGTAFSFGYDHISTHVGDEFLERNPGFRRPNYSRDAVVLGVRQALSNELTVYGEAAYAFYTDGGAEPWAFQLGAEYYEEFSPAMGGPVAAANVQLREEADYGGRFTTIAGWQWRQPDNGHLLRLAGKYQTGRSPFYEFVGEDESSIGIGLFYDF